MKLRGKKNHWSRGPIRTFIFPIYFQWNWMGNFLVLVRSWKGGKIPTHFHQKFSNFIDHIFYSYWISFEYCHFLYGNIYLKENPKFSFSPPPSKKTVFDFSFIFIGVVNGTEGFKNTRDDGPFWILEKVLSPGGSLRKQLPRGPLDLSFHFIGVGNGTGVFKITLLRWPFWNLENVLFDGTGGTEIKWVL